MNNPIKLLTLVLAIALVSCEKKERSDTTLPSAPSATETSSVSTYNFEQIPAEESGLRFNNALVHDLTTKSNVFDHDYFYNGSGVGVEDINNDGLMDIFFTGNQVPNKIYLNKGDLIFEDISASANINPVNEKWSSGVTFADVNNDGWMDIYVAQGGPYDKEQRKNLLLINQQDNTFIEQAAEYGLDDHGISTHAAFFDYDKDGDLDCVVMNENEYYGVYPSMFYKILSDKKELWENSSHLYRNDNGKFTDVTEQAGLLRPSFGLGLCISDLNNDGWPDIYLVNDYYLPDVMYVNNKNSTFSDQLKKTTNQIAFSGMGIDIADVNNDNLRDIFVLDMAPTNHVQSQTLMASINMPQFDLLVNKYDYQAQYMYNVLQLNVGNNKYHNIAQMAEVSKSDWSWAVLAMDTDHDMDEDIYVTNGYRRYSSDFDIRNQVTQAKQRFKGNVPLSVKEEIYNSLPEEKLANILFRNEGDLIFEDATSLSGLGAPSFSNGAAYSDFDNDGDLDIVVNNMDQEAFLFKNTTVENGGGNYIKIKTRGNLSEDFAQVAISAGGKKRSKESKRVRGYLSSVDKTVHFGLGDIAMVDTVSVTWPSGKYQELYNIPVDTTITFNEKEASVDRRGRLSKTIPAFKRSNNTIDFVHRENDYDDFMKEALLPYKQSTLGPCIAKGDANGDGKEDLYIGGANKQAGQLFLQTSKGFAEKRNRAFENDNLHEDMEALFIDIDSDGDQDLYVVSGGNEFMERAPEYQDRIYLNDGTGQFERQGSTEVDNYTISGKSVTKIDFDKDGDTDLIVGNRIKAQKYPLHEPSLIYENVNGTLQNVTARVAPDFEDFGIVNKVISTDINNDGWEDFIAVGEWTGIGVFLNENGVFRDISAESGLDNEKGWWFSITETDVNNDGNKDYVVGNVGLNHKYKPSPSSPLRVYADDFDLNGTLDVVMSYMHEGRYVPARGKEASTQQMPMLAKKVTTYSQFANSSVEELYGESIHVAYQRDVNQFKSLLLLNEGQGKFKIIELPSRAQSIPILDGESLDFNGDGFEDLILVGNIFHTEPDTPRLDNPFGLLLLSNQNDNYEVLGPESTGFYLNGDAKSVRLVKHENQKKTFAVVGVNNAPVEIYELNIPEK